MFKEVCFKEICFTKILDLDVFTMPSCLRIFKRGLFPMVAIVNIHFPNKQRDLFAQVSVLVWICPLNFSLQSKGKWKIDVQCTL